MRSGMVVLSEHREPIEDSGPAGKDLAHDYPTFATYAKAFTIHTYESRVSNSFRICTYETPRNRINLRHFNPCTFCTYASFCFNSFTINTCKKTGGGGTHFHLLPRSSVSGHERRMRVPTLVRTGASSQCH